MFHEVKANDFFTLFKIYLSHQSLRCDISVTKFGTKISAVMINTSIQKIRKKTGIFYLLDVDKIIQQLKVPDDMEVLDIFFESQCIDSEQ